MKCLLCDYEGDEVDFFAYEDDDDDLEMRYLCPECLNDDEDMLDFSNTLIVKG